MFDPQLLEAAKVFPRLLPSGDEEDVKGGLESVLSSTWLDVALRRNLKLVLSST